MTAEINKGPVVGMRHVQAFLIFLNITTMFIGRLNVGVCVVALTNAETTNPDFPEYDWTEAQKSYILSSFFWGYIFTQFLGGYLCKRFGVKSVMFWGVFGSGVCSALTPLFIGFGEWQAYCGIRVIMGLFQGLVFPCIHQHLAKWSPPTERNRLGGLSHTGIECGNVSAMFLSGMIAKSSMGWPGVSYVSSGIAFLWCALWFIFAADNPTESRFIGEAELHYIESSLKHSENYHKKVVAIPWKAIWTSAPFLALLVVRCSENWGLSTLQAEIPSYMNGVLDMDMKSNAFFSALPFLAMWCMAYVYLITADILLNKNLVTLAVLRKTYNSIAFFIPAVTLVGIGFLSKEQKNYAIALMTISVGVNSGQTIGSVLNTIDLSENHASILMGIVNTAANFVPIATPLVVGWVVEDNTDRTEWQIIFIIASVFFFVGNLIYLIWGKMETQPWNAEDYLQVKDQELGKELASNDAPKKNLSLQINEKTKDDSNATSG
ncbi:putative inorganic phosphate cotransporter [Drosophila ficusphila]|uniref:putative inorganic phosphate cotransporter n=1 Tax=Drosophila ficusphila TaxID=30025 RepID=UPI0007E82E23|nr:putative inorganic phosphate cotransporter [Drosophila ficusphila]